jgi:S-DNA-T family DNA segregation ATPase FtsK/SpoIIIE
VYLKEIIAHERFQRSSSLLSLALGKDAEGEAQTRDLAKMPHLLVAGTTGSGKSVAVNAMILSILYKATPEQVKFIMVDPKMLELSLYDGIPHLLLPVVTDPKKASLALQWAVDEMERRYQLLSEFKVRNIEGFNKKLVALRNQRAVWAEEPPEEALEGAPSEPPAPELDALGLFEQPSTPPSGAVIQDPWRGRDLPDDLPYIVVLIDEFADLMCVAPRDVESSVQRLAQKARAAGIHVMLATQRPSTDVITGVIKNNFPARIAFRVASRHDSATIINAPGAETLLGMGDSLCMGTGGPANVVRVHGAFVSEEEVQRVVEFWKAQGKPSYDPEILKPRADEGEGAEAEDFEHDEMYDMAVQIVCETRKASISALQRRLRVGYNRAARMIEMMERQGIVSAAVGPKGERDVLVAAIGADGPARS